MSKYTVRRFGTDTSGRGIWMTDYMHDWWETVVADLGFRPTIVQGAFMTRDGGGAPSSEGYHDQGGCIDVRTWDLTPSQLDKLVRTCRRRGAAAWRRDKTPQHGGMDPHCHITLGTDKPLSAGARASWQSYLAGHNGLVGDRPDYEWRPAPLVTTPPTKAPARKPAPKKKPAPKPKPAPKWPGVDDQTATNIATGTAPAKVKRPRVADRMRQIIARLRAGTEK